MRAALEGYAAPLTLSADESCCTLADLDAVAPRYQMINIKLDKTGGLTHALALARAARARGLSLMVGNMVGTSLAMAPAMIIGQWCRYADLDGPLLLAGDRVPRLDYTDGFIHPSRGGLWGEGAP
jgi:L-alanine-DL-glutamate epimerase-like enolase superfamily enzyme